MASHQPVLVAALRRLPPWVDLPPARLGDSDQLEGRQAPQGLLEEVQVPPEGRRVHLVDWPHLDLVLRHFRRIH